jgi:fructose-1,6-bisphosphatase/inositol monophosphatase family enzyme
MMTSSLLSTRDAASSSLVELAALEALDVIGHEVVTVSRIRDRRPPTALADWRTPERPMLAQELEALVLGRLAERFPDHAVIGAEMPRPLVTRWRWLVGVAEAGSTTAEARDLVVSVALLSGDVPIVGAVVDLAAGEVVVGRRTVLGAAPAVREDAGSVPERLFLETGRPCGGRWEASALARLAGVHRVAPRILGSAPAALLAAARGGGTVLAVGVHERDLAAGVLVAEAAGNESVWWRDAWPLAHVLVGAPDAIAPFVTAAADVVRSWSGGQRPLPTAATEWTI